MVSHSSDESNVRYALKWKYAILYSINIRYGTYQLDKRIQCWGGID